MQLKILHTFLEVFLRHLFFWRRDAYHDYGFDNINEIFDFNCKFVSDFNKLRDTATEFGLKETFFEDLDFPFKE